MKQLISNVEVVNEGKIFKADLVIEGELIQRIAPAGSLSKESFDLIIDGEGKWLFPGAIDDQVHFREPGLTHKGSISTESRAAVAGGITSFMEMPNTQPQTLTQELLEEKYQIAQRDSFANYSFYMGASNDNLEEVLKTDPSKVCGVKVFMGSSTGNMLVDKRETLESLFSSTKMLIAVHCEDEATIRENLELYKAKYAEDIPVEEHCNIRSREACLKSSSFAVELAKKYKARLHVLHISTAEETELFEALPTSQKHITAEACIHHLWFTDEDYAKKGALIRWNPAVKTARDRNAIRKALINGRIDVVATDHAPHTLDEKQASYLKAASGGPLVQHALQAMIELVRQGVFTRELIAEKMSHKVAEIFKIAKRGYIREGYYADLVLVDPNTSYTVTSENILYKCGWSPFENTTFSSTIASTWVNGSRVWDGEQVDENFRGKRLQFERV